MMLRCVAAVAVLILGNIGIAAGADAPPPSLPWRAGVATVKITPPQPMWLAGYASRNKPSEGVLQDLYAKALAIEDAQKSRVVIVTLDLLGVSRPLRDDIEREVSAKYGLPRAALLLNASHTHSGPDFRGSWVISQAPTERQRQGIAYGQELVQKVTALVGQAIANLQPAKLDYLRARAGFAMNRRRPTPQGVINAPNSDGPVDHEVPVLRVSGGDGKPRALLFGYACHNTTLALYQVCGDYAGYAQQYLQEDLESVTALFMAGCGGDQNPYPRRTIEMAKSHGRSLATAVEAALETVPRPVNGLLDTALEEISVDFAAPPSKEEMQEQVKAGKQPKASHAKRLLDELETKGSIRSNYPYLIQVVRLGNDLTMIALAGEVVVDYSLRLKRELSASDGQRQPAIWVAGYSNDVFGYVPSLRVLKEGGYEAGDAMLWGPLPGPFAPTIEERIIGKSLELARRPGPQN